MTTDQKVRGSTPLGRAISLREVAQLGRALGLGPRGRRFESCLPDHFKKIWGLSSAGRAPALHAGGQRFDPARLHHSPVMMAKRSHPFPFRTRKLSSSAPMVVGTRVPVRVGRCRANKDQFILNWSFLYSQKKIYLIRCFQGFKKGNMGRIEV